VKGQKYHLRLTLLISTLFGIILPLALGIKDSTLIAIGFSLIWAVYSVMLLVFTFFVKPGLKIKVIRHKNPTVVRFKLQDSGKKK